MPDILPISVPMPAAPAPVAGVAPAAAPAAKDASGSDFMGQLASALKGLKGIAAAVKSHTGQPADQLPDASPSDTDPSAMPDVPKNAAPTDDVTELMASLGLVLVPAQTPAVPADAAAGSAATAPIGAKVPPQLLAQMPQAPVKDQSPAEAEAARQLAEKLPQSHDTHELPHQVAAELPAATQTKTDSPVMDVQQAAPVSADAKPAAPATPHAAPAQQPSAQMVQPEGGAFQQSSGGGAHHGHGSAKTEAAAAMEAAPTNGTAAQPAFVDPNAATTTAAPVDGPAPATPQAVDVAAQIAHQVDLYKLPGSKGVRIQLHPEDLGGVQVTVKYGNGGNLELHVSVEHAATGTLVQDGLNHLRDALATHGFEPDRIVMSITAPSGANQMDFNANSNGSGSYRPDPGMTAFTQDGQSGQQGSEQDDARWARGWSSTTDSDDTPRAASQTTSSGTSVIDYRV